MLFILLIVNVDIVYASQVKTAKAYATNSIIDIISIAINRYKFDTGKYPKDSEELVFLITPPNKKASKNWNGPYLKKNRIPVDPWDNPFIYKYPGSNMKDSFDLYSTGIDGISRTNGNDKDDINNWQDDKEWEKFYKPNKPLFPKLLLGILVLCSILFFLWKFIRKIKT